MIALEHRDICESELACQFLRVVHFSGSIHVNHLSSALLGFDFTMLNLGVMMLKLTSNTQ